MAMYHKLPKALPFANEPLLLGHQHLVRGPNISELRSKPGCKATSGMDACGPFAGKRVLKARSKCLSAARMWQSL